MELLTENHNSTTLNLSPKLLPKELKKPKMYRLVNMGKLDYSTISEVTNQPVVKRNPFYISEGIETIYDKFEPDPAKRRKVIKNLVGTELKHKDGKTVLEEKIESIILVNGIIIVQPEQYFTYLFMERSNNNKSNPFRDQSKPAVWEEVEEAKAAEEILKEEDLRHDAESIARTMSIEEARAYAKKLEIPGWDKKGSDELRLDLRQRAKANARDFIKGSKDNRAKRKLQISDAKDYGIIAFDPDTNTWEWPWEKKAEDRKIVEIPVGNELTPDEFIDKFFIEDKDGKGAYKKMVDALKNPEEFS